MHHMKLLNIQITIIKTAVMTKTKILKEIKTCIKIISIVTKLKRILLITFRTRIAIITI